VVVSGKIVGKRNYADWFEKNRHGGVKRDNTRNLEMCWGCTGNSPIKIMGKGASAGGGRGEGGGGWGSRGLRGFLRNRLRHFLW